jgi:DNA-binding HxlR family transcriptional regulator
MTDTPDAASETADGTAPDVDCLCPLNGMMDLLSRRYAMQLVCVVGAIGPARYGDIEAAFDGVSSSTLSTRLDELVDAGILSREQYAEIPPRVEYDLTNTGEALGHHLEPLLKWAADLDDDTMARREA